MLVCSNLLEHKVIRLSWFIEHKPHKQCQQNRYWLQTRRLPKAQDKIRYQPTTMDIRKSHRATRFDAPDDRLDECVDTCFLDMEKDLKVQPIARKSLRVCDLRWAMDALDVPRDEECFFHLRRLRTSVPDDPSGYFHVWGHRRLLFSVRLANSELWDDHI